MTIETTPNTTDLIDLMVQTSELITVTFGPEHSIARKLHAALLRAVEVDLTQVPVAGEALVARKAQP